MNEQIEKLEHGLMICEVTGTKLVHIEKADAEQILGLLKEQDSVIEALKSDLDETLAVLGEYAEIVRCRDCVHAEPERVEEEIWCPITCSLRSMDWFCADGERKEGM